MPCSSALRASAATPKPASRSLSMVGTPTYTAGMKATEQWLFTPGTGATPPVLAGREREQEVLNGCLARMAGGRSPPHDVVDASGRLAARDALDRLGYIRCPPGQLPPVVRSAGIPSLTQYVPDQAAPAAYRRDSGESGTVARTRNF